MDVAIAFEITYSILSVIAVILIRNKNKFGWLSWNASNIFIVANFVMGERFVSVGMWTLYNIINFSSFIKWLRDEKKERERRILDLVFAIIFGVFLAAIGIGLGLILK
jgi:nicotinamide riboside transporter PnuC